MRLSAVAVTPVILLETLFSLANISVPLWSFICLAIAIFYLAMGVKANEQAPAQSGYGFDLGQYPPPMPQNPLQPPLPPAPPGQQYPPQFPAQNPPQYPPNVR
jgi:hypothetical protein